MARNHRGVRRGGERRFATWFSIDATSTNHSAAGGTILNTMTAVELAKRPFTVVRTHLELQIQSDQTAASELQLGAIGLCVVSDQAVGIGVTAVPTPVTDADSDLWFLHQWIMSSFLFASGVGLEEPNTRRYSIDSKAMRKVNDDEQVIIVAELNGAISSGFNIEVAGRLMIKEH